MPYVDLRTVRIEFYGEHPAIPGTEPEDIIVGELPSFGADPNPEEVMQAVQEAWAESGYPPRFVTDRREYGDWGASGGTQELIIRLMTDPGVRLLAEDLAWKAAQGSVLGTASFMAQQVLKKLGEIRRRDQEHEREAEKKRREEEPGHPTPIPADYPPTPTPDAAVWGAQRSIASAYQFKWDELVTEEATGGEHGSEVILLHPPSGRRFRVKAGPSGYEWSIKLLESKS